MHSLGIAVILGVVEGLTEFIPVSSTGHLILVGHLLGFVGEKAASFDVAIQLGAVLSVVFLYWRRFVELIPTRSAVHSSSTLKGWSGLWRITLATLPALIVGFLARHTIKEQLFTPLAVTWALAVGGVAILLAERVVRMRRSTSLDTITLSQAMGVGLFQVLALWPGTSRAAATIVGGMLVGLERKGAAEFSFLIAVPIMFAATGYEVLKMHGLFAAEDLLQFGVGFVVSFLVALVAVKGFVGFLSRWSLAPFAWYRIAVAAVFYFATRTLTL
ncbi:MAG TPA: undecaprenyl-diphosphate phosphatase [Candidatus Binatia bacterium]|nr:undecaprenyl-diphosphate phosphatase [Candidatus Binatia bacterium]